MNQEEEFHYIEDYLLGNLERDAKQDFEQRIMNDPEFAQQVAHYKSIIEGVKDAQMDELQHKMQEWDAEMDNDQTKTRSIFRIDKTYFRAAAALILLAVPLTIWIVTSSTSNQQLFRDYFQPYTDVVSNRSDENLMNEAIEAYNQEDFQNAIVLLKEQLQKDPESSFASLYLAESLLATNQPAQARDLYLQLKNSELFKDLADWRLALIYLQMEEEELLEDQLEQIIKSPGHDYQAMARELQGKIN